LQENLNLLEVEKERGPWLKKYISPEAHFSRTSQWPPLAGPILLSKPFFNPMNSIEYFSDHRFSIDLFAMRRFTGELKYAFNASPQP
jgi:hypothetical protein